MHLYFGQILLMCFPQTLNQFSLPLKIYGSGCFSNPHQYNATCFCFCVFLATCFIFANPMCKKGYNEWDYSCIYMFKSLFHFFFCVLFKFLVTCTLDFGCLLLTYIYSIDNSVICYKYFFKFVICLFVYGVSGLRRILPCL